MRTLSSSFRYRGMAVLCDETWTVYASEALVLQALISHTSVGASACRRLFSPTSARLIFSHAKTPNIFFHSDTWPSFQTKRLRKSFSSVLPITLKLYDCKSVSEYARKFKELHNDILSIHERLRLEENFLVFLFHGGLGKQHQSYVKYFHWDYEPINSEKPPSHWSMRCNACSKPSLILQPIAPNHRSGRQHHSTKILPVLNPQAESDNSSRQFGLVRSLGATDFNSVEEVVTRASPIAHPSRAC